MKPSHKLEARKTGQNDLDNNNINLHRSLDTGSWKNDKFYPSNLLKSFPSFKVTRFELY